MSAKPVTPGKPKPDGDRKVVRWMRFGVGAFTAGMLATWLVYSATHPVNIALPQEIPYSDFKSRLAAGDIADVTLGTQIRGTYKITAPGTTATGFFTYPPASGDPELLKELSAAHVTYRALRPATPFTDFLFEWVVPLAFIGML
jgi:hypothetical protein